MENTANNNSKMKLKVFIVFNYYCHGGISSIEVDLPLIPRIGELIDADEFLTNEHKTDCEELRKSYGSFYVRNIQHYFDKKKNIQKVFIRLGQRSEEDSHYIMQYGNK